MKKTLFMFFIVLLSLTCMTSNIFANVNIDVINKTENIIFENNLFEIEVDDSTSIIEPLLDYDNKSYISTSGWSNITNDNNWISAKLRVGNSSSNPGNIYIRVINSSGEILIEEVPIILSTTITIKSRVPFDSGTYYVQAKAEDVSGDYNLVIKDWGF